MTAWVCAPGRQPSPMDPPRPLRARQRLSSHRTARPPSRCRQDPIVVEATEVLPAAVREEKQMKWDVDDRAVIMLRQVSFSGTRAWLTLHANVKGSAEHQYNRKEEWKTITTLLKSSEAFKTFAWPNDEQAIIQWIDRQLKLFKHLWTPGMEQNEPAEAGTEGTKDETALTEFQQVSGTVPSLILSSPHPQAPRLPRHRHRHLPRPTTSTGAGDGARWPCPPDPTGSPLRVAFC